MRHVMVYDAEGFAGECNFRRGKTGLRIAGQLFKTSLTGCGVLYGQPHGPSISAPTEGSYWNFPSYGSWKGSRSISPCTDRVASREPQTMVHSTDREAIRDPFEYIFPHSQFTNLFSRGSSRTVFDSVALPNDRLGDGFLKARRHVVNTQGKFEYPIVCHFIELVINGCLHGSSTMAPRRKNTTPPSSPTASHFEGDHTQESSSSEAQINVTPEDHPP
uniref:Integrase core domain containing protein n=1 Tax=Solanum tuberosum TaxID=4113 RepID=M1E195_SOLTU